MFSKIFNLRYLLPAMALLFFISCDKEEFNGDEGYYDQLLLELNGFTAEEFTADLAEMDMGEELDEDMAQLRGKRPCFKLVFPVSVIFPDSDAPKQFDNIEDLRAAMKEWKENNQLSDVRPSFVFPLKVILRDGTILTIETPEQFQELRKDCFDNKPPIPRFRLCFKTLFPLNIVYPDGTVEEVDNPRTLRDILHKWKLENPDSADWPKIQFPIEIEKDNGDVIVINNMEELKDYIRECIKKMMKDWKKGGKGNQGGGK